MSLVKKLQVRLAGITKLKHSLDMKKKITITEEQKENDKDKKADRRTADLLTKIANTIDPSIVMEASVPSDFANNKMIIMKSTEIKLIVGADDLRWFIRNGMGGGVCGLSSDNFCSAVPTLECAGPQQDGPE